MKLTGSLSEWGIKEPSLLQQMGTAAHFQNAHLIFHLPLKLRFLWVNTLVQKIPFPLYITSFKMYLHKTLVFFFSTVNEFAYIGLGKTNNFPHFRHLAMVLKYWMIKDEAISFSICRVWKAPPNTSHTYHLEDYSVTGLYVDESFCMHTQVRARACVCECAGECFTHISPNTDIWTKPWTHQGTGSCSWVRIQCIRGHMLPQY